MTPASDTERNHREVKAGETHLVERVRQSLSRSDGTFHMGTLLGATGTGKTSLARLAQSTFPTYLELAHRNAELQKLLHGDPAFSAFKSQVWFIESASGFVHSSRHEPILVLDQDPSATVLVYSKLFLSTGHLTTPEYLELVGFAEQLEDELERQRRARCVIFLYADPVTMRERTANRPLTTDLGLPWYDDVHARFTQLAAAISPNCRIDTRALSLQQVYEVVLKQLSTAGLAR